MKIVLFAFAILLVASSCTQSYTCGRQCHVFNNGKIEICQTSYAEAAQFYKSTDSLANLYGNYTSVFVDSVSVSGSSQNAINSITGQLEQQGYTCNANTY